MKSRILVDYVQAKVQKIPKGEILVSSILFLLFALATKWSNKKNKGIMFTFKTASS